MARGTVRWFNAEKGFGFITPEHGPDIFVHYSAIQTEGYRSLAEGQAVEYELVNDQKGARAEAVRVLATGASPRSAFEHNALHASRASSYGKGRASEQAPTTPGPRARTAAHPYDVAAFSVTDTHLVVRLTPPSGRSTPQTEEEDVTQSLPFEAYLDTDDTAVAKRVFDALDDVARILGFEGPLDETLERGSIWRRAKAKVGEALDSEEVRIRLLKMERALELATIDSHQADVDLKTAQAAAALMRELADVPQACMVVRSLLLVKYQDTSGPILLTRTLSQAEIRALERYPEILTKPRHAIEALSTALSTMDLVEDGSA